MEAGHSAEARAGGTRGEKCCGKQPGNSAGTVCYCALGEMLVVIRRAYKLKSCIVVLFMHYMYDCFIDDQGPLCTYM